jgi:hypothetical protein
LCSFDHGRLKKLIDFLIVMPPQGANHARGHKFPFVAAEIFGCEQPQILEKFFDAPTDNHADSSTEEASQH